MSQDLEIPQTIMEGFRKLRKHSKFRTHRKGFYCYMALYTGYYDGKKAKPKLLADEIDASLVSIHRQQKKVNQKVKNVKWNGTRKKSYHSSTIDLKKVFAEIPEIDYIDLVEDDKGVYTVCECGNPTTDPFEKDMSPVEYLARQHKNIMKDTHWMMDKIKDNPKLWKDPKWFKLWLEAATKIRPYIKDWLDLFGHLESDMLNEEAQKRVDIMSHTIDWINGRYPDTAVEDVADYIMTLGEATTS